MSNIFLHYVNKLSNPIKQKNRDTAKRQYHGFYERLGLWCAGLVAASVPGGRARGERTSGRGLQKAVGRKAGTVAGRPAAYAASG